MPRRRQGSSSRLSTSRAPCKGKGIMIEDENNQHSSDSASDIHPIYSEKSRINRMNSQLVEIQPGELKFIFELKKQSSCSVRLTNNTKRYVAFKVKTTTPKKYCVRPNVGVISPQSASDFTVTMQSQGVAPPDMVCKDKFLIQSTIVPDGTIDEDIDSSMFSKDDGKYIQENKLRVVLISPPNSPVLSPINATLNQGLVPEASILKDPVLSKVEILTPPHMLAKSLEGSKMLNGGGLKPANLEELNPIKGTELKPKEGVIKSHGLKPAKIAEFKPKEDVIDREELETTKDAELKLRKAVFNVEELKPAMDAELNQRKVLIDSKELKPVMDAELNQRKVLIDSKELKPATDAELNQRKGVIHSDELKPEKNTEWNPSKEAVNSEELQPRKDTESKLIKDVEFETVKAVEELKLVKDIEEMKAKLNELRTKLSEAEVTISKLTEERRLSIKERKNLLGELEMLKSNAVVKNVQVGYPFLFVCMVALVSFVLGCRLLP
ncbi:hypothetical protein EZV62_007068 [Acer yangbiense]|uniref:MSP domain-containing protein n=1 Tax=Acer yangbiense TaxID=1000413 RepID=A0A5C7I891_9ROSI|nr:hypothetical protein EZV62_007068 [Acer yangbiense]